MLPRRWSTSSRFPMGTKRILRSPLPQAFRRSCGVKKMAVGPRLKSGTDRPGLADIVAPLFGGFAATGAIARTATNIRNGGNSPLAGVFHVLTLVLVVLILYLLL